MERDDLIAQIENAEMVLVGLGEDFDEQRLLKTDEKYEKGCEKLQEADMHWLLPAWAFYCTQKKGCSHVTEALEKLKDLIKEKNYYVVSVSTNSVIEDIEWKHERLVMPCGSGRSKQCENGCGDIIKVEDVDRIRLETFFEKLYIDGECENLSTLLGTCNECGQPLVLNNVYAENYNENGYLDKWSIYMKWLQGTVNRRLLVLELGVGLKFPSVIRWPFEKVAYFNQKSYFYRVHEKLYQLTAELSGKGCGISKNAIEWLRGL